MHMQLSTQNIKKQLGNESSNLLHSPHMPGNPPPLLHHPPNFLKINNWSIYKAQSLVMQKQAHTCKTYTHTHTNTPTHWYKLPYTHTDTHTYTHWYTHTHAHTHTHKARTAPTKNRKKTSYLSRSCMSFSLFSFVFFSISAALSSSLFCRRETTTTTKPKVRKWKIKHIFNKRAPKQFGWGTENTMVSYKLAVNTVLSSLPGWTFTKLSAWSLTLAGTTMH